MKSQLEGDYSLECKVQYLTLPSEYILNYLSNISIRFSDGKGRGVFADKDIKIGDVILVDRVIASIKNEPGGSFESHVSQSNAFQDKTHNQ